MREECRCPHKASWQSRGPWPTQAEKQGAPTPTLGSKKAQPCTHLCAHPPSAEPAPTPTPTPSPRAACLPRNEVPGARHLGKTVLGMVPSDT